MPITDVVVALSAVMWLPFYFNIILLGWGMYVSSRLNTDYSRLKNDPERFIIQVCTNGRAPVSVNSILDSVRSFKLRFPHETWVVIEEYDTNEYDADRVVRVPAGFTTPSGAGAKARALEFAREVRISEGIENEKTKILFLDDDSFPERGYLEYAFHSTVDIAHGYIRTDRKYGTNVLTAIADNFRVTDCIATCPTFASIGKPKLIHGEGLVARGNVELEVTWDHGGRASWGEDLMFGTKASHKFRYGFIPYSIHIASPLTVKDLFKQRRRWLWGSFKSLRKLTKTEQTFILARLYCGFMALPSIALSAYIAVEGVTLPLPLRIVFSFGTVVFVAYYALGAWLNTHRAKMVVQTLALFWAAAIMEAPVLLYSLVNRPKGFDVIRKE